MTYHISPERLRKAIKIIKDLASLRIPNYELPADSFIERAARQILEIEDDDGIHHEDPAPPKKRGPVETRKENASYMEPWRSGG